MGLLTILCGNKANKQTKNYLPVVESQGFGNNMDSFRAWGFQGDL